MLDIITLLVGTYGVGSLTLNDILILNAIGNEHRAMDGLNLVLADVNETRVSLERLKSMWLIVGILEDSTLSFEITPKGQEILSVTSFFLVL